MLFNRELYLAVYAKLYSNSGAMTKGVTNETVDGMSIQKIDNIIAALRDERYQWKPVVNIFRRKTVKNVRLVCRHGAISCFRRLSE